MLRQHELQINGWLGIVLLLILIGITPAGPGPRLSVVLPPLASAAGASQRTFPQPGSDGIPASVEQVTIAFDGWGGDVIDPWQYIGTGMMQSYLNLRLLHRDEQMPVVPLWATEWRQTNEGISLTLNPKAKWQDGTPATAEDLKANVGSLVGEVRS